MAPQIQALLQLAHDTGRAERGLVILNEGSVAAKIDSSRFIVKTTGASLAILAEADLALCENPPLQALIEDAEADEEAAVDALMLSRLSSASKRPSADAIFHAWLLTLAGANYVAHAHPRHITQVACSPKGRLFAEKRMLPDEVIHCGSASVYVPYADPGVPLAREIRKATQAFICERGFTPKLLLLQNHGAIALGPTPQAVLNTLLMAEKAAEIFIGATLLGGPTFLSDKRLQRLEKRPDETVRQQQLKLV